MFLTLSGSGLAIIYGKHFIKPVVSMGVWENWIWFAKVFHNYVGPLFFLCLMGVLIKWFRHNIVNMVDVRWFMKAGGMLGPHKGSHPSAGFSNGGEGDLLAADLVWRHRGGDRTVSGLPHLRPAAPPDGWASFIHIVGALILICGFIFHIYMGLFQLEGALEG